MHAMLGFLVASYPWRTIILTWVSVLLCSLGFIRFHTERDPMKLWIPRESKFLKDTQWLVKSFEEGFRMELALVTAPDVLEPSVLLKLADISDAVSHIKPFMPNGTQLGWQEMCFKVPYIAEYTKEENRQKRDINLPDNEEGLDFNFNDDFFNLDNQDPPAKTPARKFNPSVDLSPSIYCPLINAIPLGCYQQNLLELWKFDREKIANLTKEDILFAVNTATVSPYTGHLTNFSDLLGGVELNSTGHIVSAKGIISRWFLYMDYRKLNPNEQGNLAGTGEWATEDTLIWEEEFIRVLDILDRNLTSKDFGVFYMTEKSFGDISGASMFQDMDKLLIGMIIVFIYMQSVLSKFSWIELRLMLGSVGLLSVGMAFISGSGICSLLGVPYGPVHTSLPFLLLGLGVDDMFVMMACWRKVQKVDNAKELTLPDRIGLMLRHAGASITVTSLTDIVAFLVGSTTVLPSLQSFCIYASVGIFMTYLYAVTFFVAIFTLDERRIAARRNAVLPCIVHSQEREKLCCEQRLMQRSIKAIYSRFILTKPGKIVVLMTVIGLTGLSTESLMRLEQKFDPMWFVPSETHLGKFVPQRNKLFPTMGFEGGMFVGQVNYSSDFSTIYGMSTTVKNQSDILYNVNSWVEPFYDFVKTYYDKDLFRDTVSDYEWRLYLSKFLFSHDGGRFQANFRFEKKLECGQAAPPIKVSSFDFKFQKFFHRDQYVPAMRRVLEIAETANLTTGDKFATSWSKMFGNWITDEIIDAEVLRNIALALLCVMICTAILIVNFQICFWIFICVLLTLINVCGFMQRWGLTIDLVSCIALQLAVGLCVDYAAHIGHSFLTFSGTRNHRTLSTLLHIGEAVMYGGGSTLLALSLLATSKAYTFQAFFKIFLLVIIFGLFHGIVFLPVILSIVGPAPYVQTQRPTIVANGNCVEEEMNSMIKRDRTQDAPNEGAQLKTQE
uniref:Putative conserved plasma membrane protein n=1 Tax=Lutzomyia longipalpis TaxID=7200 RepID=A0A1B0CNT4_LUTLO